MNKMGYDSIDKVRDRGLQALDVAAFKLVWESEEALVIDTRHQSNFVKGFLPGSIFIGIDDNFAPWVGALITDLNTPILIVAEEGREEEIVTRLARVGYDNAIGYLKGGFAAWQKAGEEVDAMEEITPEAFAKMFDGKNLNVLDVRRESEYETEHLVGAENFPLDIINKNMSAVDRDKKYYLHCAGGYRSVIAASILRSRGFDQLVNIANGFKGLRETALARTEFHEQVTEL